MYENDPEAAILESCGTYYLLVSGKKELSITMETRVKVRTKHAICILLSLCCVLGSTACFRNIPMSEKIASVFDAYHYSATESTVNLQTSGYYTTKKPAKVMNQPSTAAVDYIRANKQVEETSSLVILYAEFENEIDANNAFEAEKSKILAQITESGTGYSVDNYIIGFYIPTLGNLNEICFFYLMYKSEKRMVYIKEVGPLSFVEDNNNLVVDVCKVLGFDPTDNYNKLVADLK